MAVRSYARSDNVELLCLLFNEDQSWVDAAVVRWTEIWDPRLVVDVLQTKADDHQHKRAAWIPTSLGDLGKESEMSSLIATASSG